MIKHRDKDASARNEELLPPWATLPRWSKKPPRIDIKFPILGFLMESEMTGYDLKRRFQDPIGFFYRASDGSLYPALKKLARDGLLTMRAERRGRRARKVYAITARGRARFLEALREPAAPIFVYDEAQVKIYFAHHDPQAALQHIERERRFADLWAASLEELLHEMSARNESPFRMSVVEIGRGVTSLKAELFERLRARLARGIEGSMRSHEVKPSDATGAKSGGRHTSDIHETSAGAAHGAQRKSVKARGAEAANIR
jgi:DNA-binding PadR family transcriptional regulator